MSLKNVFVNTMEELKRIIRREVHYYRLKPTHALFFLTYRCTCRCQSCLMWKRGEQMNPQEEMSLEDWKKCVEVISARGIIDIELFGGDALLRKDVLVPLINYIHRKGIHTNMTTNGVLLDNKMADELVNSGLDDFNISIDAVGDLHDQMRGVNGVFQRAKKGIQYVVAARRQRKKPEIALNATISSLNIDQIEDLISLAEELGMDTVNLEPFGAIDKESIRCSEINGKIPNPYFTYFKNQLSLNRKQAIFLKQHLSRIKELTRKTKSIYVTSENIDILTVDNLVNRVFPNRKCYICRYLVSIDPFGNILPCPFFDNYTIGNIRSKNFYNIWNNKKHKDFIRFQKNRKIGMCSQCIIGVQRNPTFCQSFMKVCYILLKKDKI